DRPTCGNLPGNDSDTIDSSARLNGSSDLHHSVDQIPLLRRATGKRWLLLAIAVGFTALGAWMLVDTIRRPATAEPGQLWLALAILIMSGGAGVLFGYEIIVAARKAADDIEPLGHPGTEGALVASYSTTWLVIGLTGSLAFALAGLLMLRAGLSGGGAGPTAIGALAAVVFGGFAAIGLLQLWQTRWSARRLSIDAAGIRDTRIGNRLIAWNEIAIIALRTLYGQRLIEVRLKDPSDYVADIGGVQRSLARLNVAFGFAPYAIAVRGLSATEAAVIAAIERFKPAYVLLIGDTDRPDWRKNQPLRCVPDSAQSRLASR